LAPIRRDAEIHVDGAGAREGGRIGAAVGGQGRLHDELGLRHRVAELRDDSRLTDGAIRVLRQLCARTGREGEGGCPALMRAVQDQADVQPGDGCAQGEVGRVR